MVSCVTTSFCIFFVCLQVFICLSICGVQGESWIFESFMGCWEPVSLPYIRNTFQPGWARWISLFPYLLLEAILLLSISASLLRLKPVEDSPNRFCPKLSFWKLCLAIEENPLACMFSGLIEGMYPAYPGIAVFLGSVESYIDWAVLCYGSEHRKSYTFDFESTCGRLLVRWSCCGSCYFFNDWSCSLRSSEEIHQFVHSYFVTS